MFGKQASLSFLLYTARNVSSWDWVSCLERLSCVLPVWLLPLALHTLVSDQM